MTNRRAELLKARAKKRLAKKAGQLAPGQESVYALKKRGVYPPNSPYLTGDWGRPMRKLTETKP